MKIQFKTAYGLTNERAGSFLVSNTVVYDTNFKSRLTDMKTALFFFKIASKVLPKIKYHI